MLTSTLHLYPVMVKQLEQSTPMDQIKGSVQDSVLTPEFDMEHLKKAKGHTDRNIMCITIKIRSIVRIF